MATEFLSFPIFLAVRPFSHNSLRLVGIYVKNCILKLLSVNPILEVVRNIAEGAKFISLITERFVLAAGWL